MDGVTGVERAQPALTSLDERVAGIRERIAAAGQDPADVAIVAVTKGFGPEAVRAALGAGLADVGENYAQELVAKAEAVAGETPAASGPVRWHFLGSPQRNKMARVAPFVTLWQGMDRIKAVDHLASLRPDAEILVQVNVVGDPARPGCAPAEVAGLVEHAVQIGIRVRGLMCVGPADDPEGARRSFATMARLGRDHDVDVLSMGMSDDFEVAVAEGSTMLRLGRALFGPRPVAGRARR